MADNDRQLALTYGYYSSSSSSSTTTTKPSALINSIFMSTVNTAAKTLVSVASNTNQNLDHKWKPADHVRFSFMLITWLTVWVLRVLMDHFPFSSGALSAASASPSSSNNYSYDQLLDLGLMSPVGSFDLLASSSSSALSSALSLFSSSSSAYSPECSLDLVEGSDEAPSVKALRRALTNILALLNEIPASSRKYQFAVSMADKIVDENTRGGHVELLHINRTALASAFARTSGLLYRSLQSANKTTEESGAWLTRVVKALPLGSYVSLFMNGLGTVFPALETVTGRFNKPKKLAIAGEERANDLAAEKHAQELLWITNKMIGCGAADEALVQWSLASGLASIALTANPRVQGFIVKISAILFGELKQANLEEISRQVNFRMLALWLPLFCYADNGLAYPVMSGYEKAEMERTINEIISSLPAIDQEVILTNWLQDFSISSSDWPNLQVSYDKWCHSTRKLVI
ncbi:hypothetical protein ACH5RR_036729 [Cinchona calisaya]|uniref:At3g05675-like ankyrin-like domain-containing protein n=1 Tax=Cinchona calisaya TaxID=153742 RepID=A0ABD2Y5S1_9GENT